MTNARVIHWYRSNLLTATACGRMVQQSDSVEHTAEGFTRLAKMMPGCCKRCTELAVSERAFAHAFPPAQEEG